MSDPTSQSKYMPSGYVGDRWGPYTAGPGPMPYQGPMSEKDKEEAEKIFKRQDHMETDSAQFRTYWQDVLHYIIPRERDVITTLTPGTKRNTDVFDTTAILANQLLAGALHGMLTNSETRFFDLTMGDPILDARDEVRKWLQDVADIMFLIFNNSNFKTEVPSMYLDLGAIGTSCLYMEADDVDVVRFSARAMKEIFIQENNKGMVDIVHRKFEWKLRQIALEFGEESLTPELLRKYKDGVEDPFPIIHAVEPQMEEARKPIHPFQSIYMLKNERHKLSTKGYRVFPYAVPRWTKTPGETYGRGPGMDMFPDIKMLNKMAETVLRGAQKTVDPPLMVADDGVIGKVRLTAGGLTIVRPSHGDPIKPLITDARIDFGIQLIEGVARRIRQGFYVDQLQLQEGPQMTATEVTARTEQMLKLMGPILGRQDFEFLRPTMECVFDLADRAGRIPKAPQAIQGKRFHVRYSSLVARAQRMSEGQNFARALQLVTPLIQIKPETLDNLDTDKAFRYLFGDVYGVTQRILRDSRSMKQMRDAQAQAHQQIAQEQQQQHQAQVAGQVLPAVAQVQQAQNQAQQQGGG